ERCAQYLEDGSPKGAVKRDTFGGEKIKSLSKEDRSKKAAQLAPILRGFCSSNTKMIGHFTDDDRVLQYINSNDLERLAPLGTSCPDHFLRTKISPLVLNLTPQEDVGDTIAVKEKITAQFEEYRKMYAGYYNKCKHSNSPAMRDPNPVVILYPGVGMFSFAKDKQAARVAAEFYINAINVMRGSEAVSE